MIFSPSEDGSFYFDDISGDEKSGSVLASSVFYGLAALQLRVTSSPPLCTFYQVDNYFPRFLFKFLLVALLFKGSPSSSSLKSMEEI